MFIIEGCVVVSGTTKYVGSEMADFNRERAIERIWSYGPIDGYDPEDSRLGVEKSRPTPLPEVSSMSAASRGSARSIWYSQIPPMKTISEYRLPVLEFHALI